MLKWSKHPPSETGWYWYRGPFLEGKEPIVIHVFDVGKLMYAGPWPNGGTFRLKDVDGELAGPLESP